MSSKTDVRDHWLRMTSTMQTVVVKMSSVMLCVPITLYIAFFLHLSLVLPIHLQRVAHLVGSTSIQCIVLILYFSEIFLCFWKFFHVLGNFFLMRNNNLFLLL